MKRLSILTIIFVLFLTCLTQTHAMESIPLSDNTSLINTSERSQLSDMSENECIEFIKQNGVEIPNDYNSAEWAPFVKEIICIIEEHPNYEFSYNYTVTLAFANAIKEVVNNYYGISPLENNLILTNSLSSSSSASLQYSTAVAEWDEIYELYNCYIHAIGTPILERHNPGYFSNQSFTLILSLPGIAEIVKDDLFTLQHNRIYYATEIDTSNLCTNEQIICFRKGQYDYHFMKYGAGDWYHKPGSSAILKYLSTPTNSVIWTNEGLFADGIFEGNTTYTSDIIYISYDGHDWEYTSNGSGTHTLSCSICSDSFAYNCSYRYTYLGDNRHSAECIHCDYTIPSISCSISRTSNGDGTHTATCTTCGHTTTSACDLQYTNLSNSHHKVECSQCGYKVTRELCTLTYTPNSDRTHTVKCTLCTNSYENGCGFTSEYVDPDQHRLNCSRCGKTVLDDCTPENTYCGDETNGDIHAKICPICDHVTEGTSETCTFAYKSNGENTHVYACTQCRYVKSGPVACMFKSGKCLICGALKNSAILNAQEESFSEN